MSHISTIHVEVRSLAALQAACRRLGFEWHQGQRTYAWFGQWVGDSPLPGGIRVQDLGKCDHAIRVPGALYEVGVVQQGDHYVLLYDFWYAGGLADALGPNAERLVQMYAVEAAREAVELQGGRVYEETGQDGSVVLHVQLGG